MNKHRFSFAGKQGGGHWTWTQRNHANDIYNHPFKINSEVVVDIALLLNSLLEAELYIGSGHIYLHVLKLDKRF